MKRVLGYLRRADRDFGLIAPGDSVAVGVSGGKDSLALLAALALYRRFSDHPFTLHAITIHMGFEPFDTAGLEDLCQRLEVPFQLVRTQIGPVVFQERRESHPCSLCARMRRGAIHDAAKALGCNKLALGHHREDALETFLMSLLYEARIHTFSPKTYLSRKDLTVIRPLVYAPEKEIIACVARQNFPVLKNPCPADGYTKRQDMRGVLNTLIQIVPDAPEKMLSALRNTAQYGLWDGVMQAPPDRPGED